MEHTFGILTKKQKNVKFENLEAMVVDNNNPNHPSQENSPNKPVALYRQDPSPTLGDDGKNSKVNRWSTARLDVLENVINQIIEHYLKDKTWYASVKGREALMNMYHRIEWYMHENTDYERGEYERVLQVLKDCIDKILDNSSKGLPHAGVELEYCPAPYTHSYSFDYLNHFDHSFLQTEFKSFSLKDLPKLNWFPAFFKYKSSFEHQVWDYAHSTTGSGGSENIVKFNIDSLRKGQSTTLTFYWRFKNKGKISFKYLANVSKGNGLLFFINGRQVGGEWRENSDWQSVTYNISAGQTYKFDWFIRKQEEKEFGFNTVYLKDIECIETVSSIIYFDYSEDESIDTSTTDWTVVRSESVTTTGYTGTNTGSFELNATNVDLECDGQVSFEYKLGFIQASYSQVDELIYDDPFTLSSNTITSPRGSKVSNNYSVGWAVDDEELTTKDTDRVVTYTIGLASGSTVRVYGNLEIICPEEVIDHYTQEDINFNISTANSYFTNVNNTVWQIVSSITGNSLKMSNPKTGVHDADFFLDNTNDSGYFIFSFNHILKNSETFEVLVNNISQIKSSGNSNNSQVVMDLPKGNSKITFRLNDLLTEEPLITKYTKYYTYDGGKGVVFNFQATQGSTLSIQRYWDVNEFAYTSSDLEIITYKINLNPNATLKLKERFEVLPTPPDPTSTTNDIVLFSDAFNPVTQGQKPSPPTELSFIGDWEWEDIVTRYNSFGWGDGVWKIEKNSPTGKIHWVSLIPMNLSEDGYVSFEYGGNLRERERFKLYSNSNLIWSGRESSSSPKGITVTVPLKKGTHNLLWEYEDLGQVVTGESGITLADLGVTKWAGGRKKHEINYDNTSGQIVNSDTTTLFKWYGGESHTENNVKYTGSTNNNLKITREFDLSNQSSGTYTEIIRIYNGGGSAKKENVKRNLNFSNLAQNKLLEYPDLYVVTFHNLLLKQTYLITDEFELEENGNLVLNFAVYNYGSSGFRWIRELSNNLGFWSSTTKVERPEEVIVNVTATLLIKNNSGFFQEVTPKLINTNRNLGEVKKQGTGVEWHPHVYKPVKRVFKLNKGVYKIRFNFDRVSFAGRFKDNQDNVFCFALSKNSLINFTKTVTQNANTVETIKTEVKVSLIDMETNRTIETRITSNSTQQTYPEQAITFIIPKNKKYKVVYELIKGNGVLGGYKNNGGGFLLRNGRLTEKWGVFYKDNKGNLFDDSTLPYKETPSTIVTTNPSGATYLWIDNIKVCQSFVQKCDSKLDVQISTGLQIIDRKQYEDGQLVDIEIKNTSSSIKNYSIVMLFVKKCSDIGKLSNGYFEITEENIPIDSVVNVYDFKAVTRVPQYMGGCKGDIRVVLKANNNTILNNLYSSEGITTFDFNNLNEPFYTLDIITRDKNVISPVTGKEYRTTFKIKDFKVFESYTLQQTPFNSTLRFYVDEVLKGEYSSNSFNFNTVVHDLNKGKHDLKWEFSTSSDGFVWDYAEIDFVKVNNIICDNILLTPYCDNVGGGDKFIEALLKCLIPIIRNKEPITAKIGKRIWLFT